MTAYFKRSHEGALAPVHDAFYAQHSQIAPFNCTSRLDAETLRERMPASYTSPMQPVSVVVTELNEAEDIGRVVSSLLAQEPAAAEVIVVDGGSTDGTWEWLAAMQATGSAAGGDPRRDLQSEILRRGRFRAGGMWRLRRRSRRSLPAPTQAAPTRRIG